MNSKNRIWILVAVVVGLGVVGLGYLLGISPRLAEAAAADASRAEAESTNALYEVQLKALEADYANLEDMRDELEKLGLQLPPEETYDENLANLTLLAALNGAALTDATWAVPTLVSADSAAFILDAATTDGAAAAGAEPPPLTSLAPDGSLVAFPVAATVRGKLESLRAFIADAQKLEQLFLVTGFTISHDAGAGADYDGYTLVVTGQFFVLVNSAALEDDEDADSDD